MTKRKVKKCRCWKHENTVCDICQGLGCKCKGRKVTDEGCSIKFNQGYVSCIKCGRKIEVI